MTTPLNTINQYNSQPHYLFLSLLLWPNSKHTYFPHISNLLLPLLRTLMFLHVIVHISPSLIISNHKYGSKQQQSFPRGRRPNVGVLHLEQAARALPHLPRPQKDKKRIFASRTDLQRSQRIRPKLRPSQEAERAQRRPPHQPGPYLSKEIGM